MKKNEITVENVLFPVHNVNKPHYSNRQDKLKKMLVFPANKHNHCFFYCRHHAHFGASLHVDDVACKAESSIYDNVVFGCMFKF